MELVWKENWYCDKGDEKKCFVVLLKFVFFYFILEEIGINLFDECEVIFLEIYWCFYFEEEDLFEMEI